MPVQSTSRDSIVPWVLFALKGGLLYMGAGFGTAFVLAAVFPILSPLTLDVLAFIAMVLTAMEVAVRHRRDPSPNLPQPDTHGAVAVSDSITLAMLGLTLVLFSGGLSDLMQGALIVATCVALSVRLGLAWREGWKTPYTLR